MSSPHGGAKNSGGLRGLDRARQGPDGQGANGLSVQPVSDGRVIKTFETAWTERGKKDNSSLAADAGFRTRAHATKTIQQLPGAHADFGLARYGPFVDDLIPTHASDGDKGSASLSPRVEWHRNY